MPTAEMKRALAAFPAIAGLAAPILELLDTGRSQVILEDFELTVITGDARKTLPTWPGMADAWFLDGFSPAKNPELWEPSLLSEVSLHTGPNGTAATYSAAGAVRRALSDAGFDVERRPGFGRKRHMTVARLR